MRTGCCGSVDHAAQLKAAGFEFLEVDAQRVLLGESDEAAWRASLPALEEVELPIEVANRLLPPHHAVLGNSRDLTWLRDYVQRVAERAARLGVAVVVLDGGEARRRPEAMDMQRAQSQLLEFLQMAGDSFAPYGVTLAIEPVSEDESNAINYLTEARALVDQLNHPRVKLSIDSHQMLREREEDEAVLSLGDRLAHVHVSEGSDRRAPGTLEQPVASGEELVHLFHLLGRIGYDQRVSISARADWPAPIDRVGLQVFSRVRDSWSMAKRRG